MDKVKNLNVFFKSLNNHISDNKKDYIKRNEISLKMDNSTPFITSFIYGINYRTVGKSFLLYDKEEETKRIPKRMFIQKLESTGNYSLTSFQLRPTALNWIKDVIFNLTDSKILLVLSNTSYGALSSAMSSNCIINCSWYKFQTDNTFLLRGIESKKGSNYMPIPHMTRFDNLTIIEEEVRRFETLLVKQITYLTNLSKSNSSKSKNVKEGKEKTEEFSFSIFKVCDIILAVLLPRYTNSNNCLINIWPIVPISSVFNKYTFLKSLKVGDISKNALSRLVNSHYNSSHTKTNNLKLDITKGITFPYMLTNRISLNQLYVVYFMEFLSEDIHYKFASPLPDCANYISCKHCKLIYDSISGFVRHSWEVLHQAIFICHLCNSRYYNLTQLGMHYSKKHFDGKFLKADIIADMDIEETISIPIKAPSDSKQVKVLKNTLSFFDEYLPRKRTKSAHSCLDHELMKMNVVSKNSGDNALSETEDEFMDAENTITCNDFKTEGYESNTIVNNNDIYLKSQMLKEELIKIRQHKRKQKMHMH